MDKAPRLEATRKPARSPDGSALAFQSDQAGEWDRYVIKLDCTGERRLTSGENNEQPVA